MFFFDLKFRWISLWQWVVFPAFFMDAKAQENKNTTVECSAVPMHPPYGKLQMFVWG